MKGNFQQLKQALKPLGELRSGGLNQLKINCPNCLKNGAPKDKFNLEVSFTKGKFHCWACNIKGGLSYLIKTYGQKDYASLFESVKLPTEEDKDKNKIFELPPTISIFLNKEATDYLLNKRGLTKEKIKERNIRYCYEGLYKGCIIFPSYNKQNQLTYFCIHNFRIGKYRERKGKDHTCFYESFIDKYSPIILTEGVYDSLSVPNSIPLLGLKLSNNFLEYLTNTKVILALDSVVDTKAKNNVFKILNSTCNSVEVYTIADYKDLNEIYLADKNRLVTELMPFYDKREFIVC